MQADLPHFAFPFVRAGKKVAVVEQDTVEHVMACENVIVRCPLGFRQERPEFGWPWPTFQAIPVDLVQLETALRRFEPRGEAKAREYADRANAAVRGISIDVRI